MSNCILSTLTLVLLANVALAQSQDARVKNVAWEKMKHGETYSMSILKESRDIKIPDKYPPLKVLSPSPTYLHCETSGLLVQAEPAKNAFWVLIFPRSDAKQIHLKIIDPKSLDGIDVKALNELLGAQTPAGYGPAKNPIRIQATNYERTIE